MTFTQMPFVLHLIFVFENQFVSFVNGAIRHSVMAIYFANTVVPGIAFPIGISP